MYRDTALSITQLKINAAGIDENLLRLLHVSGLNTQVLPRLLPLELESKFGLGHHWYIYRLRMGNALRRVGW